MKRVMLAIVITMFAAGSAMAQSSCANPMSKAGKPLSGAAKTSAIRACCEKAAVSKDGKPLSGAAKTSSVKKCVTDAG